MKDTIWKKRVNKAVGKKKIGIGILGVAVVATLVACGPEEESISREDETEFVEEQSEEISYGEVNEEETSLRDIFSKMGSKNLEEHIEKFNEKMRSSENWTPLFENRCFYLKGIKTYMPTTPREYQELFDTEFVTAWDPTMSSNYKIKNLIFEDKDGNQCMLGVFGCGSEFPDTFEEILEFSLDKPVISIRPMGHKHDLFEIYDVTFEDVDTGINDYGYMYVVANEKENGLNYVPEEIMAYYCYVNNNLPIELQDETYLSFDEMYQDTNNLKYTIEDVTGDGVAELFFVSDMYVDGYAYNRENKKFIRFDRQSADGVICYHNLFIRKFAEQMERAEYYEYNLYNTNGERTVLATQRIAQNEETKEWEYFVNDMLTTQEEYDLVAERYHMPRTVIPERCFHEYSKERVIEELNSQVIMCYSAINMHEERGSEYFQPYIK